MNYLAHIFLSGTDSKRQLGNFIGDAVKGSAYKNYPPAIADGILLHRTIDAYTDNHPLIRETVQLLRPHFNRYSAILLDIYFDYLLASRFNQYAEVSLKKYARRFYWTIVRHHRYLPKRIKRFMWHFIGTNRLTQYAFKSGIRESLAIMVTYRRLTISVDEAVDFLTEHEEMLWAVFQPFFKDLQLFCAEYIRRLPNNQFSRI